MKVAAQCAPAAAPIRADRHRLHEAARLVQPATASLRHDFSRVRVHDAAGSLSLGLPGDAHEREADAAAAAVMRGEPAPRLTPTPLLVARQATTIPTTTAAPCRVNCTDPAFLALSLADREVQFNAQCPGGFPQTGTTFFGKTIPGVGRVLTTKLLEAQSRGMRTMCIEGRDPAAFVLPGTIITYPGHSPGQDKAVDINVTGQPYVMHETTLSVPGDPKSARVHEVDIDRETTPVYNRIAFWSRYRHSIIPSGITSVSRPPRTSGSERTWTNPATGAREQITVGELYDLLSQESTGMREYFDLLRTSDANLEIAIEAFLVYNTQAPATLAGLSLPTDTTAPSVQAFRRQISADYRVLGGSAAALSALAPGTTAPTPASHLGDRPFATRLPELGFLTMPRDVLVAMTDVGLTWGAIDFGGSSGDVMHIDCRSISGC